MINLSHEGTKVCAAKGDREMNSDVRKKKKIWPYILIAAVLLMLLAAVLYFVLASGSTEKKYNEQLSLADRYLDELDYDRAIRAYKDAIRIDPERPDAYLGLAKAYEESGDLDAAIAILEEGYAKTGDEEIEEYLKVLKKLRKASEIPTPVPEEEPEEEEEAEKDESVASSPDGEIEKVFDYDLVSAFKVNMTGSRDTGQRVGSDEENAAQIWNYTYDISDTGKGYLMTGKLLTPERISRERYEEFIDQAQEGSVLHYLGKDFTLTAYEMDRNGRGNCYLLGNDGKEYVISNDLSPLGASTGKEAYLYFDIYCLSDSCVHIITIENAQIFAPYGSDAETMLHSLCYYGESGGAGLADYEVHLDKDGRVDLIMGASAYTAKIFADAEK